jgi:hypothetical protein
MYSVVPVSYDNLEAIRTPDTERGGKAHTDAADISPHNTIAALNA